MHMRFNGNGSILCTKNEKIDFEEKKFNVRFGECSFLSSPIACVACERTELLRTEIAGGRLFFFCCASKLF